MATERGFAEQAMGIVAAHRVSVDAVHEVHAGGHLIELITALEPVFTETSRALRAIKTECLRRIQGLDGRLGAQEATSEETVIDLRDTQRALAGDMARIDRELDAIVAIKAALRRLRSMADEAFVATGRVAVDQQILLALADARSIGAVSQVAFDRACEQIRQPLS